MKQLKAFKHNLFIRKIIAAFSIFTAKEWGVYVWDGKSLPTFNGSIAAWRADLLGNNLRMIHHAEEDKYRVLEIIEKSRESIHSSHISQTIFSNDKPKDYK